MIRKSENTMTQNIALVGVCVALMALTHRDLPSVDAARPQQPNKADASISHDRLPEQLDMPPASVNELLRQAESPRMIARQGLFTSIQVNVNASQNNIVGDAANESSIAISPADPNQIVIGWRQFDSVSSNFRQAGVAYSHDRGQTWTKFTLDPGHFRSDPVLGADAAGRFFIVHYDGSVDDVWRSLDGGVNWAIASASGGDKEWLKVDSRPAGMGSGHIYQTWNVQFSCCGTTDFNRSINNGVSFQPPVSMGAPSLKWGTMDIGADGTLYIAGSNLNQTGHLFIKSTNAKDPSVTPTFSAPLAIDLGGNTMIGASVNPQGMLGQVWIAVDQSTGPTAGNIYVLGSVAETGEANPLNVKFIRSTDGGQTWSTPRMINDDPVSGAWHWFGTMSVAPNGRIDVIWNDTRHDPGNFLTEVFYSYSVDGGLTWSPNTQLTPAWNPGLGYPQQNKIGDYYHMVSDNAGANLAYAATFNGEEDVYFLRISRDCNGNGIDDDCDVTCGAPGTRCDVPGCGLQSDCNGNAVPDDCEPSADCNNNTIQDICDIASHTSQDCDSNQVPDECQTFLDCNQNTVADYCDIGTGNSLDCNANGVPDECDIGTTSTDANGNEIPDDCEGACCSCVSCSDRSESACEISGGTFSGLGILCGAANSCTPGGPANDACAQAIMLPSDPIVSMAFNNSCATTDGPANVNCPASQPVGKDLWYDYRAPCTGTVTASLCDKTTFDTVIDIYSNNNPTCLCPASSAGLISCDDDSCGTGGGPSRVTFNVTAGNCYTIRVAGWNSSAGSGVMDLTYNTTCDPTPATPQADSLSRCRFISMTIPGAANNNVAIRVLLTSLHHVLPPYLGGPSIPFTAFEGQVRWVGPPQQFVESTSNPTTFYASQLQCTPHYRAWNTIGLLHVTGSAIVPSSVYNVQTVAASCLGNEAACTSVSPTVPMQTTRWGDVQAPFNPPALTVQPNFTDVSALVDKFKNAPAALTKSETLLSGGDQFGVINIAANMDFSHISQVVDAFHGSPYPFTIASCP